MFSQCSLTEAALDNVHNSNTVQGDTQSADVNSAYVTKMKQGPCVKDLPNHLHVTQPSLCQSRCAADEMPSKTSLAQWDSANQKYFSSTLLLQIIQEKRGLVQDVPEHLTLVTGRWETFMMS